MGLFSSFKQTESSLRARSSGGDPIRHADFTVAPAGAEWQAVALRGTGEAGIWPSFAVDFLVRCGQFETLEDHLKKYAEFHSVAPEQVRELRHWAERMTESGLLIGASELVDQCIAAGSPEGETPRIQGIAIPSAGSHARLCRVVTSFARNAREHGREVEITISANGLGGSAPETKALVAELARAESTKVTLMDDAARAEFGSTLAKKSGVDPEIVAFALGDPLGTNFACGANRNAMLLLHAGQPYLSLDDDVVCDLATMPEPVDGEGLVVFSSSDAFERWFYPVYEAAFEQRRPKPLDYLQIHERMLGRRVGALMKEAGAIDFVGVSDDLMRRLLEQDGQVVATFTGHFGHPGIPTSYYYLTYRGDTLARLTDGGERRYRQYLASGGVYASVPRIAIADASLSPGMAIGIDARGLIPPFPPVMHAEDFVWGAAVWQCCASGFAGHLPVAVRHDPGLGRGILAPPLDKTIRPVALWEFAHLLRGMVLKWTAPVGKTDTAARMESLGRHLREIAGGSEKDFREYVRWFVVNHESDKIGYMEECLDEETKAPEFWRKDMEDYIEQTRLALTDPDFDIPFDMRDKWPASDARKLMQRLVREYGKLLLAWPTLFQASAS